MVMDQSADQNAQEWLNTVDEKELADVIYRYGEERASRRIAAALVAARPLSTTGQLAEVVCAALRALASGGSEAPGDPGVFQAVRIAINRELAVIERLLEQLPDLMADGGRAAFISFHSLEHRLVKAWAKRESTDDYGPPLAARREPIRVRRFERLTRKAVQASEEERQRNSRAQRPASGRSPLGGAMKAESTRLSAWRRGDRSEHGGWLRRLSILVGRPLALRLVGADVGARETRRVQYVGAGGSRA